MSRKVKGVKQTFNFITNHKSVEEKELFYKEQYWGVVQGVAFNSFNETEQLYILEGLDKYKSELIEEIVH